MLSKRATLMAFSLVVLLATAPAALAQSGNDPNPGVSEWTEADYTVTISPGFSDLTLDGMVLLHEVSPPSEFGPACASPCTADDIRELYQNPPFGASKEDVVGALEDAVEERARQALQSVAGSEQGVEATATVNRTSLRQAPEGDGFHPPLPVNVTGTAPISMLEGSGYTAGQVDALFRMGARVSVQVQQVVDPGSNLTMRMAVADPLGFVEAPGASTLSTEQGAQATWIVDNWKGERSTILDETVLLGRPDVLAPTTAEAEVHVLMDFSSIDVHYTNLLGDGPAASLTLDMTVNGTFASLENPEELPPTVRLPYLSADAVRIALDEGLLPRSEITGFEDEARDNIRQLFLGGFGQEVEVHGGIQNESLARSQVGDPVGAGSPILLDMRAGSQLPLPPPEQEPGPVTGFEITTVELGELQLPAVPLPGDPSVTYTFLFPPGVDLAIDQAQGGEVTRSTTEDGRTMVAFTSAGGQGQQASLQGASLVVEHPIIWHLFWPLLLFLFLVLIVLPGAIIGTVVYRRRQQREAGGEE